MPAHVAHWRRITSQRSHNTARSFHVSIWLDMLRRHVRKNVNHFVHDITTTSDSQTREQHNNAHVEVQRGRRTQLDR
jgi:hypothetical protein